jgi:hypothetical protein
VKKIRGLLIATVLVAVSGCASLNPLDLLTEKPAVEVNANVGENVKQDNSTVKVEQGKTEQTADSISNDTKYEAGVVNQITQNIPMEYVILVMLLAGWSIPTPRECYDGAKWLIVDVFDTLIKKPIKGIADFLLLLLGRERL